MASRVGMQFFAVTERIQFRTPYWEVKPSEKLSFVDRLCWWFLRRSKAVTEHLGEWPKVTRVAIDPEVVTREVFLKAIDQLHAIGKRPSKIYMGPKEMCDVEMEAAREWGGISTNLELAKDKTLFSVPVQMVPHMKGILVV